MRRRGAYRLSSYGLLLLAGIACSDSDGPGNEPSASTDTGEMARDEVEANLDALTVPTSVAPLGTGGAGCATRSSTTDTDGDGIPDDATFTFTAPPCRFTGIRGSTLDVVGQLRLEDPAPDAAGFGYEATVTALRFTLTGDDSDDPSYTVTRNGTRTLLGTTAGLQLVTDLQVIRTFTGRPDGNVEESWTVDFEPEAPLAINQTLPSGTLDISGTLGWSRGGESIDLTVTTPTPLHYSSDCSDTPQRIDGGELRADGTFEGVPGHVRVTWSECGREPQIRFVPLED
ncbi:MAG TPA: hypothetical protein VEB59_01230 [Gemmatimonadales bacterium]|nr:hypothetical protein [Gemmatimonadales bacterium]